MTLFKTLLLPSLPLGEWGKLLFFFNALRFLLTKSNKGCRVDLFENMHKNYSLISFLLSKGKPLYGVTSQPTSTLGLNTARDFAFNSPFVNPYETKDMPVRPNSRYTYWYIGNMLSYYKELD